MPLSLKRTVDPTVLAVSRDEVKLHLKLDTTDDDQLVDRIILDAVQFTEDLTNRQLMPATWVWSLDEFPAGRHPLYVPRAPVVGTPTISYVDTTGASQSLTGFQVDAYSEPTRLVPAVGLDWPSTQDEKINAVTITFSAGYADPTLLPPKIRHALYLLCGHWYANRAGAESSAPVREIPIGYGSLIGTFIMPVAL